jgi:hemerythrin
MAGLTGRDESAVGAQSIDGEHQELFDRVRELEQAIGRRAGEAEVGALLNQLAAATRKHFAEEEAEMRAAKFGGLALHAADHLRLMEKMEAFIIHHRRGSAAMTQHGLNFLCDWLVYHIASEDRRFSDWTKDRARGLTREQQQRQAAQRAA